ncbi:NACHT domain-containing protein [Prescottella equi]|uniref:NACHT domain-containing protein n=1 Tax=Rhodococcus hoagii TaxID=43767 RepID=UPI001584599C|nr:NACHT domain-containing protein [Prescottella equi]
MTAIKDEVPSGTSDDMLGRLLEVAHAWRVTARTAKDPDYATGVALLENVVVKVGQGSAAMETLLANLHSEAGVASASSVDLWWQMLNHRGLDLIAEDGGVTAQQLTAERNAEREYRATLERRAGLLEFSLLAEDIPPMVYPELLDDICVRFKSQGSSRATTTSLHRAARRLQRFVLCGLPGSGKTTAVEQLASSWSADSRAPLPVVVNLRRITKQVERAQHVTLSILLTEAASLVEAPHRTALTRAFERELNSGSAMLVLDGLDECQARASAVADGIVNVLGNLGPEVGLMLTTRPSALSAAEKLDLPVANLLPPGSTASLELSLLNHVSTVRIAVAAERAPWVKQRSAQLEVIRSRHEDLFDVPLLSNLLTLFVASAREQSMPSSRAELLERAVKESVARWERSRASGLLDEYDDHGGVLDVDILLYGFAVIGHELSALIDRRASDVAAALSRLLQSDWGEARIRSNALATKVIEFWDERLGVFVTQQDGTLTPRSRVFVEIADSMWISDQDDEQTRQSWLASTLSDESKFDVFRLAISKTPQLADLAFDLPHSGAPRERLARWVSDIAAEIPRERLSRNILDATITELSDQISIAHSYGPGHSKAASGQGMSAANRRRESEGSVWPLIARVASLLLPPDLRRRRDDLLTNFCEEVEHVATAAGLSALADACYDGRPLNVAEREQVQAMLHLPLPAESSTAKQKSRGRFEVLETGDPLLTGRGEGAERALRFIDQLEPVDTAAIAQTSHKSSMRLALRIDAELTRLGYPVEPLAPFNIDLSHLKDSDGQWWTTRFFLALGDLEPPVDGTRADRWWCTDLFALMQVLNVAHRPMEDFREAVKGQHRQDTATLARIYASLNDIDLAKVADQVRTLANDEDQRIENIALLPHPGADLVAQLSDESDYIREAVHIVSSSCNWHAHLACVLVADLTDNALAAELVSRIPTLPTASRFWTAAAACVLADELTRTAYQLIEYDYQARCGVAMILRHAKQLDGADDVLQQLRLDRDLAVRIVAGGSEQGPPRAEIWTCRSCDTVNPIDEEDCPTCARGTKPRPTRIAETL